MPYEHNYTPKEITNLYKLTIDWFLKFAPRV